MGKAPVSDQIMATDKMKPLLALSKREPVQAAIGMTSDGEGLILLDKRAKPKKVFAMLKAEAAKAKLQLNTASLRYGRAEVDTEYDSSMVRFFINKEAPGALRVKLIEVVKRIAYQKVEINIDPTIDAEEDEEESSEAPVAATDAAPAAEAPPPPPPPPPAAAPDDTALRHLLAAFAKRIPEVAGEDAARRATLLKVAGMANDQLKAGNLAGAAATLKRLGEVLGQPAPAGASPASAPGTSPPRRDGPLVTFRKSLLRWREAQRTLDAGLKTLGANLLARPDIQADPRLDDIKAAVATLPDLVPSFGGELEDVLDAGLNAADPQEQAGLARQAVKAIDAYRKQLATAAGLIELEKFGAQSLGTGTSLHGALDGALQELRQQLAA